MQHRTASKYFILPSCLLVLNLVNQVIEYKVGSLVEDGLLRTMTVIALVLFGGSITAFVVAPALESAVRWMYKGSKSQAGVIGEALVLLGAGAVVFWLYYRYVVQGPEALIPEVWWNPAGTG